MHAHIKNKSLIWQQQYFYWFDFPVKCADTPFTTSAKSNVLFQLRKHTCDCSQCLLYRFYPVLSHLFLSGVRVCVCVCFGALPVLHALPREVVVSVLKDSSVSFSLCVSVYQPCLLQTGCLCLYLFALYQLCLNKTTLSVSSVRTEWTYCFLVVCLTVWCYQDEWQNKDLF